MSRNCFSFSSCRSCASRQSVATGLASKRLIPISSPVSSQKPYVPSSILCIASLIFRNNLRSRSRVRNSSPNSSSCDARSIGSGKF